MSIEKQVQQIISQWLNDTNTYDPDLYLKPTDCKTTTLVHWNTNQTEISIIEIEFTTPAYGDDAPVSVVVFHQNEQIEAITYSFDGTTDFILNKKLNT